MPELPEVETIRRDLERQLPGKRVASLWTSGKPLRMARPLDVRALRKVAVGHRITTLRRWGKYLLIDTDGDAAILVHLGMSGRLSVQPAKDERVPHTHVILSLDGGNELRFVDPRRFGWVCAVPRHAEKALDELAVLGVDPYDPAFTDEHLHALTRASKRSMKAFLMDQSKIAGLGNIYVVEALHGAEIHPAARADRLSKARVAILRRTIMAVLDGALANRGTTFSLYRDAHGEKGRNQFSLHVYDRDGQPCPRCGKEIRRVVDQGRSTFFCAGCQKK